MSEFGKSLPDYYAILGVLRDATQEEITAAYFSLASKLHPDLSAAGADCRDTADFKRLNEAYQILSDPRQRREYDRRRRQHPSRPRVRPWPGPTRSAASVSPSQRYSGPSQPPEDDGSHIHAQLPLTPEEARFGGRCSVNVSWIDSCSRCQGLGRINTRLCPSCQGRRMHRRQETLDVPLPASLRSGTVLRLSGKGNRTHHAEPRGDLFLHLVIKPCW